MGLLKKFFKVWKNEGGKSAFKKAYRKLFKKNWKQEAIKEDQKRTNKTISKKNPPASLKVDSVQLKNVPNSVSVKGKEIIKPFMGECECKKNIRISPYNFVAGLLSYDAISFDVFDTLILRRVNQPTDIFMVVGEKLGVFDFYNIRIVAEKEVRDFNAVKYNNREANIYEIYDRVSYYTGINPLVGVETEFSVELDFCYANPYMKRVFQTFKSLGKRIFATSNMYLPYPMMKKLLEQCGYFGFEGILVSCDYGCNKKNGELFSQLKSIVGTDSIIHIGDSFTIDVNGAKTAQIEARHYKSCRDVGDEHRPDGMSPLVGSTYRAIINNYLHNGTNDLSFWEEYGFVYGGLIALGYVNWVHKQAKADGVERILFLSRDGYILNSIYSSCFEDDIPSSYILWSRIAAMRNSMEGDREPLLKRLISEKKDKGDTVESVLRLLGIQNLDRLNLSEANLKTHITEENEKRICELFVKNWDKLERELQDERDYTEKYLLDTIKGAGRVAVVDIGWTGKNLNPLIKILKNNNIDSYKYLLGIITKGQGLMNLDSLTDRTKCYMFNIQYNREIHARFCKESVAGLEILENIFSAAQPSVMGYNQNGEIDYCLPEEKNYKFYTQIQKGILKFVDEYKVITKKYPFMANISGYDAFIPIRMVFNNKDYALRVMKDMTYSFGVSPGDRRSLASIYGGKGKK